MSARDIGDQLKKEVIFMIKLLILLRSTGSWELSIDIFYFILSISFYLSPSSMVLGWQIHFQMKISRHLHLLNYSVHWMESKLHVHFKLSEHLFLHFHTFAYILELPPDPFSSVSPFQSNNVCSCHPVLWHLHAFSASILMEQGSVELTS